MIKKHILFLLLHIKSNISFIPRILITAFIFTAITLAACVGGSHFIKQNQDNVIHFNIAMVVDEDSSKIENGMKIVTNTESLHNICDFLYTDMDSALDLLSTGKVAAVVVLPAGFVESIQNGTNTPARLILPAFSNYESLLFSSVITAGSRTLSNVQSGIYAVDELLDNHDRNYDISDAEDYLNETYIKLALNRTALFKKDVVSPTGTLNTTDFYLCSGIIFVLVLCGISVTGYFIYSYSKTKAALYHIKVSFSYKRICELISVSVIFFVMLLIPIGVIQPERFSLFTILSALLIVISIASFIMCISVITNNQVVSSVIILLFCILGMYSGGRILPEAYIPKALFSFGQNLSTYKWCTLLEKILYGTPDFATVLPVIIHTIVFISIALAVTNIKGRRK